MWLAYGALIAAGASQDEVPTSTIVAGGLALASAVIAAWLGARGTLRTADTQRETAFDKRVDDRLLQEETKLARSEARLEEVTADRDRYRELYAQLRLDVMRAGLDPDELGGGAAT